MTTTEVFPLLRAPDAWPVPAATVAIGVVLLAQAYLVLAPSASQAGPTAGGR